MIQLLRRTHNRTCGQIADGSRAGRLLSFPVFDACVFIVVACVLVAIDMAFPSTSQAQLQDPHVGVTIKAGSTGAGFDVTKSILQDINIRIGYNRFQYSGSFTESGIKYDGDLKLETVPVFLDWHVFSGGFRMTTGLLYNNNTLDLDSRATGTVVVGNTSIDASTLGTLKGRVELGNSFVPYLGLGWGNAVDQDQRWGVAVDVGVFYQGQPDVTLTQSGSAVTAADLAQEERNIEDALDGFKFYPVATFGLFYRF